MTSVIRVILVSLQIAVASSVIVGGSLVLTTTSVQAGPTP